LKTSVTLHVPDLSCSSQGSALGDLPANVITGAIHRAAPLLGILRGETASPTALGESAASSQPASSPPGLPSVIGADLDLGSAHLLRTPTSGGTAATSVTVAPPGAPAPWAPPPDSNTPASLPGTKPTRAAGHALPPLSITGPGAGTAGGVDPTASMLAASPTGDPGTPAAAVMAVLESTLVTPVAVRADRKKAEGGSGGASMRARGAGTANFSFIRHTLATCYVQDSGSCLWCWFLFLERDNMCHLRAHDHTWALFSVLCPQPDSPPPRDLVRLSTAQLAAFVGPSVPPAIDSASAASPPSSSPPPQAAAGAVHSEPVSSSTSLQLSVSRYSVGSASPPLLTLGAPSVAGSEAGASQPNALPDAPIAAVGSESGGNTSRGAVATSAAVAEAMAASVSALGHFGGDAATESGAYTSFDSWSSESSECPDDDGIEEGEDEDEGSAGPPAVRDGTNRDGECLGGTRVEPKGSTGLASKPADTPSLEPAPDEASHQRRCSASPPPPADRSVVSGDPKATSVVGPQANSPQQHAKRAARVTRRAKAERRARALALLPWHWRLRKVVARQHIAIGLAKWLLELRAPCLLPLRARLWRRARGVVRGKMISKSGRRHSHRGLLLSRPMGKQGNPRGLSSHRADAFGALFFPAGDLPREGPHVDLLMRLLAQPRRQGVTQSPERAKLS